MLKKKKNRIAMELDWSEENPRHYAKDNNYYYEDNPQQ